MMIFLGMWACQHRELKPIAFGGWGNSNPTESSQQGSGDTQNESGFGRGRGRERSVQNGDYEMDEMNVKGDRAV